MNVSGPAVAFVGCLTALILDRTMHLHFTHLATVGLIAGVVLAVLGLCVDWEKH